MVRYISKKVLKVLPKKVLPKSLMSPPGLSNKILVSAQSYCLYTQIYGNLTIFA